jgi:hypothetical protein
MGLVMAYRQNAWAMNPVIIFRRSIQGISFWSNEVPDLPEAIEKLKNT